ncbi:GGDEF domain-containing protein [Rhodoferax sp. TS-BS-61-7]|uniref:GGDEF domain-containing protein n=1 Tax=Rhodoferax sp. TS-BS-61-7 TaxID=2094194 RepID=UPI001374D70D|nr:GGDEF domain-containing protein [Rhodoferax sp. TS-BS-61-7]
MLAYAPPDSSVPVMQVLHQAQLALKHGDVAHSLVLAKSALARAQAAHDLPTEARSLLALSQADRMVSRFRRAQETAQRAATLFQMCEDTRGEAEALATLSHTLSVMGHSEEGVEAALLGLKLNADAPSLSQALSYNYLGVAYACGGSFDRADAAFRTAIGLLEDNGHWMEAYLPRVNQRAMEVSRCFFDRYYQGQFACLERLGKLRRASVRTTQAAPNLLVFQGAYLKTQALLGLSDGFEACWLGDLATAQSHADFAQAAETRGDANPSVTLMELWLRAEIAWAARDWQLAEYHCHRMMQLAMSIDNEHMVSIAYLLLAQILTAQGKERASQVQLRALKQRENDLRHAALQQREERIEWQLQARASRATARRLAQQAQQLEQLAMEDALTGLFNRRYLERMVPDLLRKGSERGLSPAMAFVDVDYFKRINDRFSHQVGDAVLQELAQILRSFVREGDVPVRLGGDEFVVAFAHVEEAAAHGLAQRIQDVVASHPWERLRPGLSVSVSVGLAGAQSGDSLRSWLHRCDVGMYVEKDTRHQSLG